MLTSVVISAIQYADITLALPFLHVLLIRFVNFWNVLNNNCGHILQIAPKLGALPGGLIHNWRAGFKSEVGGA